MERETGADALNDYLFDACGYVRHPGVMNADGLAPLRDDLTSHWRPTSSPGVERVRDLAAASPRLAALGRELPVRLRIHRYINQPYRLIESYALRRAAGSTQGLHNGFSEPQTFPDVEASRTMWRHHTYHDGRTYCMMVKILLYLTTIASRADGPFCFVEGSHKANFPLPVRGEDLDAAIAADTLPNLRAIPVQAGDALVLNEALMHGTLPKTSNGPRMVLAYSYAPRFVSDYEELPASGAEPATEPGFYA